MSAVSTLSDGVVVARRNLIKIKRVPDLLVFTTLSPIMFVLLFAYVFGGAIDPAGGGAGYREFLMAGIFAQTVIFGATNTGAGLAEDVKKGDLIEGILAQGRLVAQVVGATKPRPADID